MKPSYVVFRSSFANRDKAWKLIRWDDPTQPSTTIGYLPSKREAMQSGALLAGWQGRVAFTTDPTTYPW